MKHVDFTIFWLQESKGDLILNLLFIYFVWKQPFFFFEIFISPLQKPKQKDWHPPGGFILGLWALIIMVFFKTYGIKHMKHIF